MTFRVHATEGFDPPAAFWGRDPAELAEIMNAISAVVGAKGTLYLDGVTFQAPTSAPPQNANNRPHAEA